MADRATVRRGSTDGHCVGEEACPCSCHIGFVGLEHPGRDCDGGLPTAPAEMVAEAKRVVRDALGRNLW